MTGSKNDLTDLVGLCNEVQERAEAAVGYKEGGESLTAESGTFLAALGLMADLFKRVQAIEERLPLPLPTDPKDEAIVDALVARRMAPEEPTE